MTKTLIVASLPSSLVNFRGHLIEALLARGDCVEAAGPPSDAATLEWLTARGVRYHTVELVNTGLSAIGDLRTFFSLRRMILAVQPDILIAYTIKPVVYGMLAAASAGVKARFALITGLGFAFTAGDRSIKRLITRILASTLYRLALRRAKGVFFQNVDDAILFQAKGLLPARLEPIVVNGSGVNFDTFQIVTLPQDVRFLMIARLVADKGVREFIEAARQVKRIRPEIVFDLVGPKDSNPAALPPTLVPDAMREGTIVYHGATTDVRPFLAAASVYVLPSYREGAPRTVLEAMAMGRAIITTDAPGCRDTVTDGDNGFLVPPRNVPHLVRAMMKLINDPALVAVMGRRSREICEERYDVNTVTAAMLQHIRPFPNV